MKSVPILDLARDDAALAPPLHAAFTDIGFVAVTGHGVRRPLIDDLYRAAGAFFDLPEPAKQAVARRRPEHNRGYVAIGGETLARLAGEETPPDHKEVYTIGPLDVPDSPYFAAPEAYPSFVPNLWPDAPASLRPAMEAYWHAVTALAGRLLGIAALSLGLPRDYFAARTDRHISMLRLICYPPYRAEPRPGQLRAGVHTDLNMLTLVHADSDTGGLEVRARDGTWIAPVTSGRLGQAPPVGAVLLPGQLRHAGRVPAVLRRARCGPEVPAGHRRRLPRRAVRPHGKRVAPRQAVRRPFFR